MSNRGPLLATMLTTTTYGTWLPGDLRGYVDDGVILPGDFGTWDRSRERMKHPPVLLSAEEQRVAFEAMRQATEEFEYTLHAIAIESWHMHALITHRLDTVATAAGRLKTRVRQALNRGRVWTTGYDKRYCFTEAEVRSRAAYIQRHAGYRPFTPDAIRHLPLAPGSARGGTTVG